MISELLGPDNIHNIHLLAVTARQTSDLAININDEIVQDKLQIKRGQFEDEEKFVFKSQGTNDPITQTVESKLSQYRETGNTTRRPAFFPE